MIDTLPLMYLFFDSKNEQSQVDTGIAHFLNVVQ